MVKFCVTPLQPLISGVTVTVAVTGVVPLLKAVKVGIDPDPLVASPIDAVLFVQLNIVPVIVPVKFIAAVADWLQTVWLFTAATVGVGATVRVTSKLLPVQPFAIGVTT